MSMPTLSGLIDEQIKRLQPNSTPEQRTALAQLVGSILTENKTVAEVVNFPKEQIEFIYSYAIDMYEAGNYTDASKCFNYLYYLHPKDPRFVFSYAASLHKLKQYQKAAEHYLLAAAVAPQNPTPWFHGADCFVNLGNIAMADAMLTRGIEIAGDQPQYAQLKDGAEALKGVIAQFVQKKPESSDS